jgi:hypothetical protein
MEKRVSWLCPGTIVVEPLTLNPRIEVPIPLVTPEKKKMEKRVSWLCPGTIVVEYLTLSPMIEVIIPPLTPEERKWQRCFNNVL